MRTGAGGSRGLLMKQLQCVHIVLPGLSISVKG